MTGRAWPRGWHGRSIWRCTRGVSAVEFALFAPVLFFALVVVADLGSALQQRMTIDHILRAAAQSAMMDPGIGDVRAVLEATVADAGAAAEGLILNDPVRYHSCPGKPGIDNAVLPGASCEGANSHAFYVIGARKTYEGMFLPIEIGRLQFGPVELHSSMEIQVR